MWTMPTKLKEKTSPVAVADAPSGGLYKEKEKAVDLAFSQIEKQFGQGSIMRLGGEGQDRAAMDVVPTGSLALDVALGAGGVPRGRVVEVFGPEGSGKTTLTLHVIAESQRAGGVCAFVDAEHALNVELAESIGVDLETPIMVLTFKSSNDFASAAAPCKTGTKASAIYGRVKTKSFSANSSICLSSIATPTNTSQNPFAIEFRSALPRPPIVPEFTQN